jgi:hypothetical protein
MPRLTGQSILERVRGVEPLSTAWKAVVIPIYDTRSGDRELRPTFVRNWRFEQTPISVRVPLSSSRGCGARVFTI